REEELLRLPARRGCICSRVVDRRVQSAPKPGAPKGGGRTGHERGEGEALDHSPRWADQGASGPAEGAWRQRTGEADEGVLRDRSLLLVQPRRPAVGGRDPL